MDASNTKNFEAGRMTDRGMSKDDPLAPEFNIHSIDGNYCCGLNRKSEEDCENCRILLDF